MTTYGELRRRVTGARARLRDLGVGPGDRVAVVLGNNPAFVVAYLGIVGLGAVVVPLNPASPALERGRQLATVDVSEVVDDVATLEPDGVGPAGDRAGKTGPRGPGIVERNPDDLAALMFTAGTAGAPRPAMLTHGNLVANIDQILRDQPLGREDVVLGVLPLFHIFGLNVVLGCALAAGARVLLIDRFDPRDTLSLIRFHGVTALVGPPTMYAALAGLPWQEPGHAPDEPGPAAHEPVHQAGGIPSVRLAITGAAPLSREVAERWKARYGIALRQGYGLTEASPVVTSVPPDGPVHSGSIGVPLPGVEVRLVDEEGEEALAGDSGEIWVRGPNVFPGYWRDQPATELALTQDGWLRTGDVAVTGDDGQLYLVDRAKDLIIVSGFNVFPAEVEAVLIEHPAVADVAVVGKEDDYQGETVHAFVVKESGHPLAAEELTAWARQQLAPYKCPSQITFLPAIPHGLAGKLFRRSLLDSRPAGD